MTDESFPGETIVEIGEAYETLQIRLPQSTIARMDEEIAAHPRYQGSRSEFVFCAVEYALYCIPFAEGLEWLEESEPMFDNSIDVPSSQPNIQ